MAHPRASLSITLPPSFTFSNEDGDELPKTPEPRDEPSSVTGPPPPPRQTYKVKRKRAAIPLEQPNEAPGCVDTVIPTIEMSEDMSEVSSPTLQPTPTHGLLSPLPSFQRLVSPPRTPAARASPNFSQLGSPSQEWALINETRDKMQASRGAGSVCSSLSDSSISSQASSGFSALNGGCASPESEATDPFVEDEMKAEKPVVSLAQRDSSPSAKRVKRSRHVKWTPEMDQHLEATYIRYLQDPRVTPFKTLPGVIPPLGVCHRVASMAKHTWSQRRVATPTPLDTIIESGKTQREGSPDTIRPDTLAGSSHTTDAKHQPQWPRSDAATRRRLRVIVKHKPSLSAHYQRLLRTRSPSPFTSSSATYASDPPAAESSFSSRDMKMSLVTSTAPSMQPGGPLAQLGTDEAHTAQQTPLRTQSQREPRPADWFARIPRSQAHQKSQSLQSSLSLDNKAAAPLASPFDEDSNRSHLLHSMETTKSLGRNEFHRKNTNPPSLGPPFEVHGAPTLPRSLKRRFKSDEEKPRRPCLEDVFGPLTDESRNARSRGFTVGAARATDNLTKLFVPPNPETSPADHEMTEAPQMPEIPLGSRSAPRRLAEPVPRLGSPFMEVPPTNRLSNTFPRRFVPTADNPNPFERRLRELAGQRN